VSGADRVLELVLDRVQARLDGQFRDSDALDAKALGVLGADAAALGVLIAAHDGINTYWWIPGLVLGAAGLILLAAIWPRTLDSGPNWRLFYEQHGGGEPEAVGRQMLAELLAAVELNDAQADRQ
jgi:hypothetical protein